MLKGSSVELLVLLFTNMWVSVKRKKKSKLHNFPVLDEVYGVENTRDSELFPDKKPFEVHSSMVVTAGGQGFKKNNVQSFFDLATIDLLHTCFLLLAETTGLFPISTDEPFQLER